MKSSSKIFLSVLAIVLLTLPLLVNCSNDDETISPLTTQTADKTSEFAITSVLRVLDPNGISIGTGFVHKEGIVITAEHVVSSYEADGIVLMLSTGEEVKVTSIIKDSIRDLAILYPANELNVPTATISQATTLKIGDQVAIWGYPSGYQGNRALLTVGYLSGEEPPGPGIPLGQFVINAAFNLGNSGGPLVRM